LRSGKIKCGSQVIAHGNVPGPPDKVLQKHHGRELKPQSIVHKQVKLNLNEIILSLGTYNSVAMPEKPLNKNRRKFSGSILEIPVNLNFFVIFLKLSA
jgi:hypothetical protein